MLCRGVWYDGDTISTVAILVAILASVAAVFTKNIGPGFFVILVFMCLYVFFQFVYGYHTINFYHNSTNDTSWVELDENKTVLYSLTGIHLFFISAILLVILLYSVWWNKNVCSVLLTVVTIISLVTVFEVIFSNTCDKYIWTVITAVSFLFALLSLRFHLCLGDGDNKTRRRTTERPQESEVQQKLMESDDDSPETQSLAEFSV